MGYFAKRSLSVSYWERRFSSSSASGTTRCSGTASDGGQDARPSCCVLELFPKPIKQLSKPLPFVDALYVCSLRRRTLVGSLEGKTYSSIWGRNWKQSKGLLVENYGYTYGPFAVSAAFGFIAKLSVNSRARLRASGSLLFQTSATLLSSGSSGLGADSSA
jgi:hypothetical protein